jgi:hypothetical protein
MPGGRVEFQPRHKFFTTLRVALFACYLLAVCSVLARCLLAMCRYALAM